MNGICFVDMTDAEACKSLYREYNKLDKQVTKMH